MIGLTAQEVRQVKQQYLRQNIPEQLYEDFGEFCQQQAGSINIDQWTPKYIEELVFKFKKQRQKQENNPGQTSFVIYQTGNSDQVKEVYANIQKSIHNNTDSILSQLHQDKSFAKNKQNNNINSNHQINHPKIQPMSPPSTKQSNIQKTHIQKQKQKTPYIQQKPKSSPKYKPKIHQRSAVDLLDSVFQQASLKNSSSNSTPAATPRNTNQNKELNKNFVPHQNNFKTQPTNTNGSAFFDSVNFWAVPSTENSPNQKSKKQQKKAQKFSQSSSSSFSNLQYDPFGDFFLNSGNNNKKSNDESKSSSPTINTSRTQQKGKLQTSLDDFNFLISPKIQQNNKKTSPYLKKQKVYEETSVISNNNTQLDKSQSLKSKGEIKIKQIKIIQKQQQSQIQSKKKKIPYDGQKILKQQFEDEVKCHKSTIRNVLADPDLTVVIHKHQIISRSFIMPDYVMYTLRILPVDIQCKRNYQDFTKLRNALQRVYPGIHLPYLQKNSWLSQTNADFIKKQKIMLQFFLSDIIQNKQLRNSRIFQDFLSLKQHKKMKRKFQQYQKMEKLNGLQELCLLDGKIDIKLKSQQIIYQQKVSKYILKMEQYLQRHKKLSETLSSHYQSILDTINSLTQLMKLIKKQTKDFNSRVTINQISNLQDTFQVLQNCYKESYNQNKYQFDLLDKKIIPFLHYQRQNIQPLKELINTRNYLTKRYLKRVQTQQPSSSNIPYDSEKLKYYKNGVLQQSKNMFVFKYQIGFLNNQICKESQRLFQSMGIKFKKKWDYLAKKEIDRIIQSNNFWKDIRGIKQY